MGDKQFPEARRPFAVGDLTVGDGGDGLASQALNEFLGVLSRIGPGPPGEDNSNGSQDGEGPEEFATADLHVIWALLRRFSA